MGAFYETIPKSLIPWILAQHVIWIASAPLSASGHVNVSPKGGDYFGIADEKTFWYQDLTGSGVETLSHLHEPHNGRITVMLNAFTGPPRIVRLWGHGRVLEYGSAEFESFVEKHSVKTIAGTRAIVVVDIEQVGSSCGFSMPFYDFKGFRTTLNEFFEKRVAAEERGEAKDGIERYWAYKNAESMDGLPGLKRGVKTGKKDKVEPIKKMVGAAALHVKSKTRKGLGGTGLFGVALISFVMGIVVAVMAMEFSRGGLKDGLLVNYSEEIRSLVREIRGHD